MVSVDTSLVVDGVWRTFVCVFTICASLSVKLSVPASCLLLLGLLVLLLSGLEGSFCVPQASPVSGVSFAGVSSWSVALFFMSLTASFGE